MPVLIIFSYPWHFWFKDYLNESSEENLNPVNSIFPQVTKSRLESGY